MIEGLARARQLLIACDFDGTLAPIVDDPDSARALPEAVAVLRRLAGLPGVSVAIVSGRKRSELVERFGTEDFVLIGEHGADDGGASPPEPPGLRRARELVEAAHEQTPGSRVEHKSRSVVFHYRLATSPEEALTTLRRQAGVLGDVQLLEGKAVLELTTAESDKGDAIAGLARRLGADRTVFIGDDTTDEAVFARLGPGDLGIKVGEGDSAATHRVADPEAVVTFLEDLARRWEQG